MPLWKWSKTPASNGAADATCSFPEGMAGSAVNDSSRGGMAALAQFRDDTNGTLTTGGTLTAYTVSSNSGYDTLAHLDGQIITVTMHATSGAAPTLVTDSLTAKPLRISTGTAPPTGAFLIGSVYSFKYGNSVGEYLLLNQTPVILGNNSVITSNITPANVTYATIQNVAADSLLGNPTGSGATVSEITLGAGLSFSGTTLVSAPLSIGGAVGLVITNDGTTPNTKATLTADQIIMVGSSQSVFASAVSLSINCATTGANAMDAGSIPISGEVHFYSISNGSTTAGLGSISATSPTMPSGYIYKVRLGSMLTDSSGNFLRTKQRGCDTQYIVTASTNTAIPPIISSGTAGTFSSVSTVTYASTSVTGFVPSTATKIRILATQIWKAGSASNLLVAPNTSYGGTNNGPEGSSGMVPPLYLAAGATVTSAMAEFELESTNIGVVSSASGGAVACLGWTDKVNAS